MMWRLAWLELKVLVRDPLTWVFSLGLPLLALLGVGFILGNDPEPDRFGGLGAVDYYVPAYVIMVVAAFAWVSVPRHIAAYRERGILRRYRAAGMSPWPLLMAFGLIVVVLAAVTSLAFATLVGLLFGVSLPNTLWLVIIGFLVAAVAFAAVGITLGVMLPSARVAEVVGVVLWFALLVVGGAGVPRQELTVAMQRVQDATPVWHAVQTLQDAWFGMDAGASWLALLGLLVVGVATASLTFRLE
jgi:ABC-2 type transport system permease protein